MKGSDRRVKSRKFKVFIEPAKAGMTSLWDLDHVPSSAYEKLRNSLRTGKSWIDKLKLLFTFRSLGLPRIPQGSDWS